MIIVLFNLSRLNLIRILGIGLEPTCNGGSGGIKITKRREISSSFENWLTILRPQLHANSSPIPGMIWMYIFTFLPVAYLSIFNLDYYVIFKYALNFWSYWAGYDSRTNSCFQTKEGIGTIWLPCLLSKKHVKHHEWPHSKGQNLFYFYFC